MAKILAILLTHGLIILTKFDEDQTKIVDLLLVVYFWASVIFYESVSRLIEMKQKIYKFLIHTILVLNSGNMIFSFSWQSTFQIMFQKLMKAPQYLVVVY